MAISGCTGTSVDVMTSAAGGAPVTLRRVTVTRGRGKGTVGAAVSIAKGAEVVLEGCHITRNDAKGDGSAVSAAAGSTLQLRDTRITSNNGTGVYFQGRNLTILNSSLTGNAAVYGGAIYAAAATSGLERTWVVLKSSVVAGNRATKAGGGIALGPGARLQVEGSSLYRNAAPEGGAVAGMLGSCLVNAAGTKFTGNGTTTGHDGCVHAWMCCLLHLQSMHALAPHDRLFPPFPAALLPTKHPNPSWSCCRSTMNIMGTWEEAYC
jgi:hypothetical protein